MAQTIPPARYAEQYAIYAQKYRGGKFTVTLKNVLVRGVDASGVPTERRSATREHALPSARIAITLCVLAIWGKVCQEARFYDAKRDRVHTITRGRRTWKPPLPDDITERPTGVTLLGLPSVTDPSPSEPKDGDEE